MKLSTYAVCIMQVLDKDLGLHKGGSNGELKCGPVQSNFLILISTMDPNNKVVPFPIIWDYLLHFFACSYKIS